MKLRGNKLTALLLALCIILGLAACGGSSGKKSGSAALLSGMVYVPEFLDMGLEDVGYIDGGCCDGANVYIVTDIQDEEEVTDPETGMTRTEYTSRTVIYRIPLDGSGAAELENYAPLYDFGNGEGGWSNVDGIRAGSGGTLWVTERATIYNYDLPEDFDETKDDRWNYMTGSEDKQVQRQLDSTGKELQRFETGALKEKLGAEYVQSPVIDEDGSVYVCYTKEDNGDGVAVLDKDGSILFNLEDNAWGLVRLGDGAVAARYYNEESGTRTLRVVDKENKKWGDEYPITNANKIYDGTSKYLFYYDSGDSLYGYNASTGGAEKLLSWSSADIDVDSVLFFTFLEDGRVVAMTQNWGRDGQKNELAVLSAVDASTLPEKTNLVFACMYLSQDIRASIIDFNKNSGKYRIEIQDYSEYNTDEDNQAGLTRLNTEIIAGNVPDILFATGLPIDRYGAKGFLEDLWPLIDADPDISREDLMENVFKAAESDGKLYQVFDSFSIMTAIGSQKVVGDRLGWTLADMQAALATMPDGCTIFGPGNTQGGMLRTVMSLNLDSYIDWEAGESHFDSEQFKAALEFCKGFLPDAESESINWDEVDDVPTRIANGQQMLQEMYLSGFGDIQMYEAMFGGSEALQTLVVDYGYGSSGGYTVTVSSSAAAGLSDSRPTQRVIPGRYISYVGFPKEDGGIGSCFNLNQSMAISSTCADKEAAWSFVRQILLPSADDDSYRYHLWAFPSNKADFDKMVEEAMKKEYITDSEGSTVLDDDGNPVEESKSGWGWGSLNIDIMATTQEEYDQVMELYNAIDSVFSYDTSVYDIVVDLAGAYFSGDRSLDETVKQIQDRVNIYINENR